MVESSYKSEPGVTPVRVQTLRGLRLRARHGQYAEDSDQESRLSDFFTNTTSRDRMTQHRR